MPNFDEQIRRAFDSFADRLRHDVSRDLDGVADELQKVAAADRDRAAAEAADAARREAEELAATRVANEVGEAERRSQARLDEAVADAERRAEAFGREAGKLTAQGDVAASARLVDAVRAIDEARSLTEVLDTLVGCAGREANRAAILLVRGIDLRGWRLVGFGPQYDAAGDVKVNLDQAGIVADAIRGGLAVSGDSGATPSFAPIDDGRERFAAPIVMAGQPVAVLYADQAGERRADTSVSWPALVEVMTRHAARTLEALTAFKAARALTERPDVPLTAATEVSALDDHDDEAAAQRFAKLLVSEIRLYHEQDVIAGRRERNLMARVGGEIARARSLYEERVPAEVRQRSDYFGEELVRTLAGGDASLFANSGR